MDQKLTEEQQRSAHKIIKANRGNCGSIFLPNISCIDCPNSSHNSGVLCFTSDFLEGSKSPAFQAENLRRSQAWLDAHITDAEIMAESPREFCERMVRTEGNGRCRSSINYDGSFCKTCVLSVNGASCCVPECFHRAQAYLASHPATPQEPPKRRPTPEEMVVGATVRVRLWDEMVRDGVLDSDGFIIFESLQIIFNKSMRKFCGTTHKIIRSGVYPNLDFCDGWSFIPEMLDYVEPEKVAEPKPEAKEKVDTTVKGDVDKLPLGLLRLINFRDLLPTDALRIIALEGQVDDLTKKLAASKKLCEKLQRRLRAKWEAKRDGEMATREEIIAWFDSKKGAAMINGSASQIRLKDRADWIPATRGNLKL